MANGDTFGLSYRGDFGSKLLDGQSASDNGQWVAIPWLKSATVASSGIEAGATVTVQLLNDATLPLNSTDGFTAATLTAISPALTVISDSLPARWIKAKKVAGGAPTATTINLWGLAR